MEIEVVKSVKVCEKLSSARVRFQEAVVKPSGKNAHLNAKYFELSDILPVVNKIGHELGFVCVVCFGAEEATLDFTDIETGAAIRFTSPMSTAALKNCHAVQNLGAVQTYIKRYLYQNTFEIVESDVLNGSFNNTGSNMDKTDYKAKLIELVKSSGDESKLKWAKELKEVSKFMYEKVEAKIYAAEQVLSNETKELEG